MGVDEKLLRAAIELVKVANKRIDNALPGKLAGIVKTHSMLAVGSAFVPIPGADLAAGIAAIWGMYYRINSELQLPFGENVIKSIASGVATNLTAYAGMLAFGSMLKFFPGIGTVAAIALMSAAAYALTMASGYIYLKALTVLLGERQINEISESDLRNAVDNVMNDKQNICTFVNEAKKSYKK